MLAVERLHDTREALINALQAGDWERVGELDGQCRTLVALAMQADAREDQALADALDALLETYRELIGVCRAVQERLADELGGLQRGRKGAQVYQLFS